MSKEEILSLFLEEENTNYDFKKYDRIIYLSTIPTEIKEQIEKELKEHKFSYKTFFTQKISQKEKILCAELKDLILEKKKDKVLFFNSFGEIKRKILTKSFQKIDFIKRVCKEGLSIKNTFLENYAEKQEINDILNEIMQTKRKKYLILLSYIISLNRNEEKNFYKILSKKCKTKIFTEDFSFLNLKTIYLFGNCKEVVCNFCFTKSLLDLEILKNWANGKENFCFSCIKALKNTDKSLIGNLSVNISDFDEFNSESDLICKKINAEIKHVHKKINNAKEHLKKYNLLFILRNPSDSFGVRNLINTFLFNFKNFEKMHKNNFEFTSLFVSQKVNKNCKKRFSMFYANEKNDFEEMFLHKTYNIIFKKNSKIKDEFKVIKEIYMKSIKEIKDEENLQEIEFDLNTSFSEISLNCESPLQRKVKLNDY